jgi:hypothetical protein
MGSMFRKLTVRALGAHKLQVDFVETGFVGQTDFIFVRYSPVNNDLMNSSRVLFNIMKVTRIFESICKISHRFPLQNYE